MPSLNKWVKNENAKRLHINATQESQYHQDNGELRNFENDLQKSVTRRAAFKVELISCKLKVYLAS